MPVHLQDDLARRLSEVQRPLARDRGGGLHRVEHRRNPAARPASKSSGSIISRPGTAAISTKCRPRSGPSRWSASSCSKPTSATARPAPARSTGSITSSTRPRWARSRGRWPTRSARTMSNVTGFINLLDAARLAGVKSFVYAASSSTYGDEPDLPKREDRIGNPLSPYAATKLINEIYAGVYFRSFRLAVDRPALFQRVRRPPGPQRGLCGGHSQMAVGDDRRPARSRFTATARPAAISATSPMRSRPICARRCRVMRPRTRSTMSRSASALRWSNCSACSATASPSTRSTTTASRPMPVSARATCSTLWPTFRKRVRCSIMHRPTPFPRASPRRCHGICR